jgi:hypothetical protein
MLSIGAVKVPQPFPYQGGKRNLATVILEFFPEGIGAFIKPFAGPAAAAVLMLPFRPLHKPASFVYRVARDAGFGFQALAGSGETQINKHRHHTGAWG